MQQTQWIFLLLTVFFNSAGTILVKKGANRITEQAATTAQSNAVQQFLPAVNFYTIAGLGLLGLSFVVFILVLSKVNVSVAQPLLSLAYIFTAVGAYFIFGEAFSFSKIVGIVIIILGVYLVSR